MEAYQFVTAAVQLQTVCIERDVYTDWRSVGPMEGLRTDTQIARFLLQRYRESCSPLQVTIHCIKCQNPLKIQVKRPTVAKHHVSPNPLSIASPQAQGTTSSADIAHAGCLPQSTMNRSDGTQSQATVGPEQVEDATEHGLTQERGTKATAKTVLPKDDCLFRCASCESAFFTQTGLKLHVLTDHTESDGTMTSQVTAHLDESVDASVLQSHTLGEKAHNQAHKNADENVPENVSQNEASSKRIMEAPQDPRYHHKNAQADLEKGKLTEKQMYPCSKCDMSFPTRKRLKKHKGKHVSLTCSRCSKHFNLLKTYQNHMVKIHGESLLNCGQCGRSFQNSALLLKHKQYHCMLYSCNDCTGAFSTIVMLTKHQKCYHADMVCPVCQVHCKGSKNLDIHIQTHTAPKSYFCTDCGRSYETRSQLVKHKLCHSVPIPCTDCSETFYCKRILRKHQKEAHADMVCPMCQTPCKGSKNLDIHIQTHTEVNPYLCTDCGKSFETRAQRTIHKRSHRAPYSPNSNGEFVCSQCGLAFRTSTYLQRHMHKHGGENAANVCTVCRTSFRDKYALAIHYRIHTGEKPYVCSYCGLTFRTSTNLKVHVRKHTGEKPYVCPYCGMAFRKDTYLTEHKRTHTGEKPFLCDICGVGFAQKGMLNSHKKTHTKMGDESYVSTYISMYVNTESHSQNGS